MGDLEKDLRKRQAAQALRMTKILLCLGLAAVTLLAFAGAENESQERSIAESFHPRALRAAEPAAAGRRSNKRGRKNKKRKKQNKNENKNRKRQKTEKKRKQKATRTQ